MRSLPFLLLTLPVCAQTPQGAIHPTVRQIVASVSEERITANLRKLEGFGTRHILSAQDDPVRGIGAARKWIFEQFRSYSPRLEVRFDTHLIPKQRRVFREVEIHNVVAVLPGKTNPEAQILISGHYDSLAIVRRAGATDTPGGGPPAMDDEKTAAADAPGVNDDGSGTAAVMELARVLSQHEFDKTLIFIAFAGEEEGLLGSTKYAEAAKRAGSEIEAVLNNDIIGNDLAGNGRRETHTVRVFSADPGDSPSRQLARYVKLIGERYVPAMKVDLVFRQDRFGRGGDHTPFANEGFAAVRFSEVAENYSHQHNATDTFSNVSPAYCARVARVNAAVAASLALAPKAPTVISEVTSGPNQGRRQSSLTRGKGYDALLKWTSPNAPEDLAGYAIVLRSTTAPDWEKEIYVGKVNEYLLENLSIDDVVFGVKAIDREGHQSLVSAYQLYGSRAAGAAGVP